jgi:hypothetical protein
MGVCGVDVGVVVWGWYKELGRSYIWVGTRNVLGMCVYVFAAVNIKMVVYLGL